METRVSFAGRRPDDPHAHPHVGRERRLTILLVEQRVVEALELCDRGYVLATGRVVLAGGRDALLVDARVQRAYLGG